MDNISLHIEYLLLRHDCVILPGIGAFINIYQAPYFDDATGQIVPPSREIRFNPALRSDDGMLANSIARKSAIPYREGSEILTKTVAEIGRTLLLDQEVTIGRLGIIRREQEGNLRFFPFKSVEKRCSELGLVNAPFVRKSTLNSSHNDDRPLSPSQNLAEVEKAGYDANLQETEQSLNERIGKMNFKRNYYLPINKLFLKACACFLIVACCAIAWWYNPYSTNKVEERASVIPLDKVIDSAIHKPHNEEKQPKEKKEEAYMPSTEDMTYQLIVATCTSEDEALRFIKAISPTEYSLKVIPSRKLFRVTSFGSNNRQELIDTMRSNKFKQVFKEAWILEKQ